MFFGLGLRCVAVTERTVGREQRWAGGYPIPTGYFLKEATSMVVRGKPEVWLRLCRDGLTIDRPLPGWKRRRRDEGARMRVPQLRVEASGLVEATRWLLGRLTTKQTAVLQTHPPPPPPGRAGARPHRVAFSRNRFGCG